MRRRPGHARAILEATAAAAETLLLHRPWEEAVRHSLALLGRAARVSRVYVFENHRSPDGRLLTSQRFEWTAPGVTPQIDNPELQNFPWVEGGFGRWVGILERRSPLYGRVCDFPPGERELLSAQDIVSIAVVPIFAREEWWGFIGFDECRAPREWLPEEISALQLSARILGASLERRALEEEAGATTGLATAALGSTTWGELAEAAFSAFAKVLQAGAVSLYVADLSRTWLEMVAFRGATREPGWRSSVRLLPLEGNCVAYAVQHGRTYAADLRAAPPPFAIPEEVLRAGVRSTLLLPLVGAGQVVGVLCVDWHTPTALTAAQLDAAERLALVLAVAVQRLRSDLSYRELFENVPVGLYRSTPDGTLLQANQALADMLGYPTPEALRSRNATEFYAHPQDRVRWEAELRRHGRLDGLEVQFVRSDGRPLWALESAPAVFATDGRVLFYEGSVTDLTVRKELEERVEYLSRHDPLTGLPNRGAFLQEVERALSMPDAAPSVLIVDLHHFGEFNEREGRQAGDRVLVHAAEVLRSQLRPDDVLARVGADEFAVLLRSARRSEARRVALRLLRSLQRSPGQAARGRGPLSAHVGIAVPAPSLRDPDTLLSTAHAAVEEAKARGGICLLSAPREFQGLEDRIRLALQTHRLWLAAQPILDLRTGRFEAWELLLRLRGDDRDLHAKQFLPAAERTDLIKELDEWVLRQALALLRTTRARLHVNISGRTLQDPRLLRSFQTLLQQHAREARRLVVEITETCILHNLPIVLRWVRALRSARCQVAVDDFGTGYSSLVHLRHLRPEQLKVDGSLVREAVDTRRGAELLKAVVQLGHALGCVVVAEWVCDENTLRMVQDVGADAAQGYWVGMPVAAEGNVFATAPPPSLAAAVVGEPSGRDPGSAGQPSSPPACLLPPR
jgi:diguanylate cyclase (GGDEF)-like protein/PAS domain S-box-containing protein